jgi:hypothetical protein
MPRGLGISPPSRGIALIETTFGSLTNRTPDSLWEGSDKICTSNEKPRRNTRSYGW